MLPPNHDCRPRSWTSILRPYALSGAVTALTYFIRLSLDPVLGNRLPYALFLFPLGWLTSAAGPAPAAVCLFASAVSATWSFAAPRQTLMVRGADMILSVNTFLAIGALIIVTVETQRRARVKAEKAEADLRRALAAAEEQQRMLEAILDFVPEGIAIVDAPDGRVRLVSQQCLDVIGLNPESVTGTTAAQRVVALRWFRADGETPVGADDLPSARALRGETVHNEEYVIHRPDGAIVTFLYSAAPIRDASGAVTGGLVAYRDITERKRFEEGMRATAKLESLGILAGGIAHDFNNLLTGVLGNASLLLEEAPRGSSAEAHVRAVLDAAEAAAKLAHQMLAYSGRGQFVIEPVDLTALVRQTAVLIGASIPKNVVLDLALVPDLPSIDADAAQIQQVVMNLAINAAEAAAGAEGRVVISTARRRIDRASDVDHGEYVALEVTDNGCGMDDATVARIFDPFFTTKFTGRGLGLSAVQGIVRGHKGVIRVQSKPGRGTTFTVLLPVGTAAPASAPEAPSAGHQGGVVLVVDDEEIVRMVARRALERRGFEVLDAADGESGLRVLCDGGPAVSAVVLDVNMPGPSCEETLGRIRAAAPGIPVVLSSGYTEAESMARFAPYRIAAFLQKPYTAGRLVEKVAGVVSGPERAETA